MEVRVPWPQGAAWRQSVALDGRVFRMAARWNEVDEYWSLDILTRENEPIVRGVKIAEGVLLTSRYADDRLPRGWFVLVKNENCPCTPGRNDMRENAEVIYVPAF